MFDLHVCTYVHQKCFNFVNHNLCYYGEVVNFFRCGDEDFLINVT